MEKLLKVRALVDIKKGTSFDVEAHHAIKSHEPYTVSFETGEGPS